MSTETPRFIESRYGKMLIIEHVPDGPLPDTWLICLNSGLQNRSGPRRIYVNFARALAATGVGVIRVDLPGVGDSDGPVPPTHFDCYDPLDVGTVVDHLRDKTQSDPAIFVHGLCAGARVAIRAAARDPRISGVVAWSATIYTPTPGSTRPPEVPKHGVSKAIAEFNRARAVNFFKQRKFLKLTFWREYFGQRKFVADMQSFFWSAWNLVTNARWESDDTEFVRSLKKYTTANRPILFVYGERDQPSFGEYQDLRPELGPGDLVVVPGGTHTFSTRSMQLAAISNSTDWVKRISENADVAPKGGKFNQRLSDSEVLQAN